MPQNELITLRERLEKLQYDSEMPPCVVRRKLDSLNPEIREIAERLINDPGVSVTRLHAELKKGGIVFGRNSIGQHRANLCTCSRREEVLSE